MNSRDAIHDFNALKPQCPVMMQTLKFSSIDSKDRSMNEYNRLLTSNTSYTSSNTYNIPYNIPSPYNDTPSYIFPSCGHVHGYHQSLTGKPCPLCRINGDFVPLLFEFDSCLFYDLPTHVFNPCGHAGSLYICEKFSIIPTYVYDMKGYIIDQKARCPYCCKELNDHANGGPFNRIILQTEGVNNIQGIDDMKESEELVMTEGENGVTDNQLTDNRLVEIEFVNTSSYETEGRSDKTMVKFYTKKTKSGTTNK
jgi:Pellino